MTIQSELLTARIDVVLVERFVRALERTPMLADAGARNIKEHFLSKS